MNPQDARREELQRRCQDQREEFIAAAAASTASLPGARRITRALRFIGRLLRILRRGVHRQAWS